METEVSIAFRRAPQTTAMTPPFHKLAFRMVAAFRAHSHVNNVLTHISRGNWVAVEQSLRRIFDPVTTGAILSPLEQNLVDLMHAERGVTGRVLKPFFRDRLGQFLEAEQVEKVCAHVEGLYAQLQQPAVLEPSVGETAVPTTFDLAAS